MNQPRPAPPLTPSSRWPLERILFALAGTVTLASALLVALISPWFLLVIAFVGITQWLYVGVGTCPAAFLLQHLGVEPACGREQDPRSRRAADPLRSS